MMRVKWVCLLVLLVPALAVPEVGVLSPPERVELWVDDDPGCEDNSPCYGSIQEAIDAAPELGIIHILPGTYEENLVIQGKEISLRGSGVEVTLISAPDPTRPAILAADLPESERGFRRDYYIRGLQIRGGLVGIQIERAAATIDENRIIITGEAGVRALDSTYVKITNNEIQGPRAWRLWALPVAIDLGEGLGEVKIEDNHIRGLGIDIASGDLTIWGNHIESNRGFFVKGADRLRIYSNHIVAEVGILFWDAEWARIEWNTIQVLGLGDGVGIGIVAIEEGVVLEPLVAHNLIQGGELGIGLGAQAWESWNTQPETRPIIEYNTIQHAEVGVGIYAPPAEEYGRLVRPIIRYNLLQNNGKGLMAPAFPNITFSVRSAGGAQLHLEGNRFEGNVIGVELGGGVQANLIGNYLFANGHGVSLGHKTQVNLQENRIIYNRGYGVAINGFSCRVREGDIRALRSGEPEVVEGQDNEIHDNGDDLCPDDYPWPPGFVRE